MCRLHNAVTTINVALFSADANKNSGLSKKNRRIPRPCRLPEPERERMRSRLTRIRRLRSSPGTEKRRFPAFRALFGVSGVLLDASQSAPLLRRTSAGRVAAPQGKSLSFLSCLSLALAFSCPPGKSPRSFSKRLRRNEMRMFRASRPHVTAQRPLFRCDFPPQTA